MAESTKISIGRYAPLLRRDLKVGFMYPRNEQGMYVNNLTIVRESPEEVFETLFPKYRIFGFRKFDFRHLDFNLKRYSGLYIESTPGNSTTSLEKVWFQDKIDSARRKPTGRRPEKLSMEAEKMIDYVASWSPNGPINNSDIHVTLKDLLVALDSYVSNEDSKETVLKAQNFISDRERKIK